MSPTIISASGRGAPAAAGPLADRTGLIFDIKRFAIHDGPGIRTTVFFKGCPLSCRWCHNPESIRPEPERWFRASRCTGCGACVAACPRRAIAVQGGRAVTDPARCELCGRCDEACPSAARRIVGRRAGVAEVIAEIEKDLPFYEESGGGATFSGGEPFYQPAFLKALLEACKARDIHTAVDTTCHAPPEAIEAICRDTDLFLCDVKHADGPTHKRLTGVGNELILENIRRLVALGRRIIIRIPVIPGLNDDDANIEATARFARSLAGVERVDLLPYNAGGKEKVACLPAYLPEAGRAGGPACLAGGPAALEVPRATPQQMAAIAERLRAFGFVVKIGG